MVREESNDLVGPCTNDDAGTQLPCDFEIYYESRQTESASSSRTITPGNAHSSMAIESNLSEGNRLGITGSQEEEHTTAGNTGEEIVLRDQGQDDPRMPDMFDLVQAYGRMTFTLMNRCLAGLI